MTSPSRPNTDPKDLAVVLIPGLFSPQWLMRPLGAYLRRRFANVAVYDHPYWLGDLEGNRDALFQFWKCRDRPEKTALVSHSFGDWLVRDLIHRSGQPRPTHLISIAPVVTSNTAAKLAVRCGASRIGEMKVMTDPSNASANLSLPSNIRHLAIWPRIDHWIPNEHRYAAQTLHEPVWATHNSALMQPNVMRRVAQFLRCQTASAARPRETRKTAYAAPVAGAATRTSS